MKHPLVRYLEMMEPEINSEEDLLKQRTVITRLIPKLVRDKVLVQVEEQLIEGETGKDPVLLVHPNYVADGC